MNPKMLRYGFFAACLAMVMVILPGAAFADSSRTHDEVDHLKRGNTLYHMERYDLAAEEYAQAYNATQLPGLLYNLGQSFRHMGEKRKALQFYLKFLELKPHARGSEDARIHVAKLQQELAQEEASKSSGEQSNDEDSSGPAEQDQTSTPGEATQGSSEKSENNSNESTGAKNEANADATAATEEAPEDRSKLFPVILSGSGLTLATAGLMLLLSVRNSQADLDAAHCAPNCSPNDLANMDTRSNAGYVLLGLGGAAAATGLILFISRLVHDSKQQRAYVAPTVGGIIAGHTF